MWWPKPKPSSRRDLRGRWRCKNGDCCELSDELDNRLDALGASNRQERLLRERLVEARAFLRDTPYASDAIVDWLAATAELVGDRET
jgi:predicted transcriptional regulator